MTRRIVITHVAGPAKRPWRATADGVPLTSEAGRVSAFKTDSAARRAARRRIEENDVDAELRAQAAREGPAPTGTLGQRLARCLR